MSQPSTPENRKARVSWRKKLLKGSSGRGGGSLDGDSAMMGRISPSTTSTTETGSPRAKGSRMGGYAGGGYLGGGYISYSADSSRCASEQGTPRKSGMAFLGLLHKTRTPNSGSPNMGDIGDPSHELDSLFTGSANPFFCNASLALHEMVSPKQGPKGPQVKPFIFTQSHQTTTNRPGLGTRCLICDDFLQTKLLDEKIVDLKCGDFVHSECFQITINYEIERLAETSSLNSNSDHSTLIQQIFPKCTGKECLTSGAITPMLPMDESYVDEIIVNALIAQQDHDSKTKNSNLAALGSTLESNKNRKKLQYDSSPTISPLITPKLTKQLRPVFGSFISDPVIPTRPLKPRPRVSLIRESSINTRSPSPNSSISTMNTETIKITNYKGVSTEALKDQFIQYLIDNCPQFSLSTLLKLGPLRLVDQLLVSTSSLKLFEQKICYLFTNYLAIWTIDGPYPILFPLDPEKLSVSTHNESVLRLRTADSSSCIKEILLNSEVDSIIEKWVVAVSDFCFCFPSDVLTSTIILPKYRKEACSIDEVLFPKPCARRNSSNTVSSVKKSNSTIDVIDINNETPIISKLSFPSPSKVNISYADSDSDSDSDLEKITNALNLEHPSKNSVISMIHDNPSYHSNKNQETDSDDDDSDQELIDDILKQNEKQPADGCENGWNALFADITLALVNNQNY
ncbi:unnamed protein product [Debaryomyces fabryi]|nr:unnamed protein product [Debaryomyces fabryi]